MSTRNLNSAQCENEVNQRLSKRKDSKASQKAPSKPLLRETQKSGISEKRSNSERRARESRLKFRRRWKCRGSLRQVCPAPSCVKLASAWGFYARETQNCSDSGGGRRRL